MRVKVASRYRVESGLWTSTEQPTYKKVFDNFAQSLDTETTAAH